MCYRPAGIRQQQNVVKRKATPSELAQALGTSFELDEPKGAAGKQQPTTNANEQAAEMHARTLHIHN